MRWLLLFCLFLIASANHKLYAQASQRFLRTDRDSLIVNSIPFEKQDGYKLYWTITNNTRNTVLAPGEIYLYHDSPYTPINCRLVPLKPNERRIVPIILYPHRSTEGGTFIRDAFVLIHGATSNTSKSTEKYPLYISCTVSPRKP
jgi:hypothetical protein